MDSLPANIKKKMEALHLTAYAVEKRTGIKKSTIYNILLGRVKSPSIDTVYAISKALDCNVSDLIGKDEVHPLFTEDSTGYILNWQLYIDTLVKVGILLGKTDIKTNKHRIYELIEEVYQYSLRTKKQSIDPDFAEWAIHKVFEKK
jgi:transcriptional regulator with XRE-family HTH domain